MPSISKENQKMLDSFVMTYKNLSWLSKLDLPAKFNEAILAYKKDDLDTAFAICHTYINAVWFGQGLFYDPLSILSGSDLVKGLICLGKENLLTEKSMRSQFNTLAENNKPLELAHAWVHAHQKGLLTGNEDQISLILIIENPKLTTTQWHILGEDYYAGRGDKVKDNSKARVCFEQVIKRDSKYASSLFNLGWLHEHGEVADANLIKSREYYQRAAKTGHVKSKKQLLLLDNPNFTANQWLELGENYYYARHDKTNDFDIAHICFQEVIRMNPLCPQANFLLGWMHKKGQGCATNIALAKAHFEASEMGGSFNACIELLQINQPDNTTADAWYNLGQDYQFGRNGQNFSELRAAACYKLATIKDEKHVISYYNLGFLCQYNKLWSKSYAKKCYEKAKEIGHEPSRIQLLILNQPKLNAHVVNIHLILKKISSYYPWVSDDNFSPNLLDIDIETWSDDIEMFYNEFIRAYERHNVSFDSRVRTLKNEPLISDSAPYSSTLNELVICAQDLWKRLERYRLTISIPKKLLTLLGPDASLCEESIDRIEYYLTDFQKKLGELSDLALKIPVQLGGRSYFFSLGHYLSTISTQFSAEDASLVSSPNVLAKINFIQKIASFGQSTESICLCLIFIVMKEIEDKQIADEAILLKLLERANEHKYSRQMASQDDIGTIIQELYRQTLAKPFELDVGVKLAF